MTYTVTAHNPTTNERVSKSVADLDSIEAAIVTARTMLPTGFRILSITRPVVPPSKES